MERGWVRELDLRKCGPGSVAERVGFVPGLRSSADYNTPYLEPHLAQSAQTKPSPCSAVASESLTPLDDIPPLSLDVLTNQDDKAVGLQLVADSVSEMGSRATRAVILHPLSLASLVSSWAAIYRFVYMSDRDRDAGRALMLASGLTMLCFAAIRFLASGYSTLADKMDQDWLRADYGGDQDVVLGARAGQLIVGALVLRLEPKRASTASPNKRKNRSRSGSLRGGKGIIRAWTTNPSHRGQGIGKELLNKAIQYTKDKCGKDAQVGFAQEHANSVMLLPGLFNKIFRTNEARAASALNGSVKEWDSNKRKR
ncbi:hypothetical protein E4U41_007085 [Claviceps citrina]|nr:hypothetical protein E4U41_007085 [Claviceps citrina]